MVGRAKTGRVISSHSCQLQANVQHVLVWVGHLWLRSCKSWLTSLPKSLRIDVAKRHLHVLMSEAGSAKGVKTGQQCTYSQSRTHSWILNESCKHVLHPTQPHSFQINSAWNQLIFTPPYRKLFDFWLRLSSAIPAFASEPGHWALLLSAVFCISGWCDESRERRINLYLLHGPRKYIWYIYVL